MEKIKSCGGCRYFVQHHMKRKNNIYQEVYSGHCYPRLRTRNCDMDACEFWEKTQDDSLCKSFDI